MSLVRVFGFPSPRRTTKKLCVVDADDCSGITIRQTVQVGGASGGSTTPVAITGRSLIEIACGKGAAGRACEGAVRIEAEAVGETE